MTAVLHLQANYAETESSRTIPPTLIPSTMVLTFSSQSWNTLIIRWRAWASGSFPA